MLHNEWKPTIKQTDFLALPYSVLEAFYAGAVGAGKSDVLLLYPIIHRLHENPRFKGLFLRRTFPELKNEIIPRSRHFFRSLGAEYNSQDKLWTFPSGALFFFGHCENEDDVHKYDSMQPNYVAFDELTSFTEWQYLYITLQRVRTTKGSGLPAIVRSASNPGNIGHNWVRKRFIDPCRNGCKFIKSPSGIKRIYIPARVTDNPHIDSTYLASLEALPEAEKRAKLHGDWSAYEGQVFEEFRERSYPNEPSNALHVIDSFDIPSWWPKIVAIDWGFTALTWMGFAAISPNKRVYLYREMTWHKTKIEEWCADAKSLIDEENPRVIKLCKSAGQDRGQEHTILQQVSTALDKPVQLTSNTAGSRVAGKMLIHEYLRWKPRKLSIAEKPPYSQEHAEWLLRNRGLREYQSYLDSFIQEQEETNLPKLLIFKENKHVVEALKSCIYDKNNPEDVAEFDGDDPYDGLRYLVDAADRYFDEAESEMKEIEQREELTKQYETTQNMTAFYRNARALESKQKVPVMRRYH